MLGQGMKGERGVRGARGQGSEGDKGRARGTRPLSLTEAPWLLKLQKASWGLQRLQEVPKSQEGSEGKGSKGARRRYVHILGFKVTTTFVGFPPPMLGQGWREWEGKGSEGAGEQGDEGEWGGQGYVILGFRVPTTCEYLCWGKGQRVGEGS